MRVRICRYAAIARVVAGSRRYRHAMPDAAYTYWYVSEFFGLMVAVWAMMFILDRIWPSNYEREHSEKKNTDPLTPQLRDLS